MTIAFFKSRCLICWKGFEVPVLPDASYGEDLYYDKTAKTFSHFTWFDNKNIENFAINFLSKNPEFQSLNDETKGNTARQIVGFIANGDHECVLGFNRCPHCGLKFNSVSDTRIDVREIKELNFSNFFNLDSSEQELHLRDKIKIGL